MLNEKEENQYIIHKEERKNYLNESVDKYKNENKNDYEEESIYILQIIILILLFRE